MLCLFASCTLFAQQVPPSAGGSPEGSGTAKTIIGCLSGPDEYGRYELRSMQYRKGVEVLPAQPPEGAPNQPVSGTVEELRKASGSKVKLTGTWLPAQAGMRASIKPLFQITALEVLAAKCQPPAETTPVSKRKPPKSNPTEAPPK